MRVPGTVHRSQIAWAAGDAKGEAPESSQIPLQGPKAAGWPKGRGLKPMRMKKPDESLSESTLAGLTPRVFSDASCGVPVKRRR